MFDEDFDIPFSLEAPKLDDYVDPAYPEIKAGVKFTPIERGNEYSVYTVLDAHPVNNEIKVGEIVYTWITGYYARLNKTPFEGMLNRDYMLKTHSPACQGKKKTRDWRRA